MEYRSVVGNNWSKSVKAPFDGAFLLYAENNSKAILDGQRRKIACHAVWFIPVGITKSQFDSFDIARPAEIATPTNGGSCMAIFKILEGPSSRIDLETTPYHKGWAYFTPDDGGLYIDSEVSGIEKRIRVTVSGAGGDIDGGTF